MEDIILEPDPARVMEGLRDTGYDFNMAMADLVDNSIAANASTIKVFINQLPNNEVNLYIADNGCGMTMEGLKNAMRYGSNRRQDASSLGKFGLGLKTASTAFCRSLSLMSRGEDGNLNKVQWDLDEIIKINKWKLLQPSITDDEKEILDEVAKGKTGTLVIWEKVDRLTKDYQRETAKKNALNKIIDSLKFHFSMVYQRFIDPNLNNGKSIDIYINEQLIEPWDPFCSSEEERTVAGEKYIKVELPDGETADFFVKAYVLPRKETFSSTEAYTKARINNDMQGFYIYRENRLLHHGDWADIRRNDPHFSLARVELSFDHKLDEAFNVDIKKSRIHINEDIADFLEKEFLPACIREAEDRYRKLQRDEVVKKGTSGHDASGVNIEQNANALQASTTEIINEAKNEVKVTNSVGQFTTTIKILPSNDDTKQHRVIPVDSIDGNILWEPTLVDGDHAVSINRSHDFYSKVYGPNLENQNLIEGLDFLLWGLAEAELSTYNSDTREQYEEMRNQVSRILKKLVKELPDPDTEE